MSPRRRRARPARNRPTLRAGESGRRLQRGDAATPSDIAQAEQVTLPLVSRYFRLAYLSPLVLERLPIHRHPCALPLDKLATAALAPWAEQSGVVFED